MTIQQPSGIQQRRFFFSRLLFCKRATWKKCLWLTSLACIALVLSFASPAQSQSCATCKDETATVGFVANVCTHHDDYTVTLNGQTLFGFGSCAADIWVTTNKAYTQLTVDQTYVVTAADSCSTHIAFDVPEGFKLEIDGVEKSVIDKSGGTKGSGDGTWNIVLRKECPGCGDEEVGKSCKTEIGSVDWSVSMGRLSDGRWAQSINLFQDALGSAIYTPSALIYSPPGLTNEVDVIRNGDQSLRQVKSTQALADVVVTIPGQEYEIRFYRPADVGSKINGIYSLSGQPQIIWRIKNPEPLSNRKLQLSKIQGAFTDVSEYTRDVIANSWTLTTGGGLSVKTKTTTYPTATSRNETTIVREANGQLVSKVIRTYRTFSWGEELVQEIVDPDGAAIRTVYSYYEQAAEPGRYTKLNYVSHPDGSWEKYDYDAIGNRTLVMRPWKDLTLSAASEANSYAIRYTYSNFDGVVVSLYPRLISSIEEQIGGVTVRKTTYSRSGVTVNGNPATREVQTVYASATLIQTKTTTTFHYTADPFYANRVSSIEYPDGRSNRFTYERGNYVPNVDPSLSQFIPDANGLSQRETIIHGTTVSPNSVAFKTTQETSVQDLFGNEVLRENYVYNGNAYERIEWVVNTYDDGTHVIMTRDHKGQLTTAIWTGDKLTSETDSTGTETVYEYDELNRVKKRTKKGIAAGGGFPAQPDIVSSFSYDAEGRSTSETVSGGGPSLTTTRAYDKAGRLTRETNRGGFSTDAEGLTTIHSYSNGGRTHTRTHPGGATEIDDRYLDGQSKSKTGSAVVAQYFDFGVNGDGTRWRQEFRGPSGLSSPRWTKTTLDWIGRTVSVEKPSFTGVNTVDSATYNSLGQLQKQSTTSNAAKVVADRLFEYDELGAQTRNGLDIDNSGTLTLLSNDRLSEMEVVYQKVGSDWFRVTSTKSYLIDNNDTPAIRTQRERLNNFSLNGGEQTISDLTSTDFAGNVTATTTIIDRAAKKQIATTDTPDSNLNAVSVSINGLLQMSTATTPENATTYAYDSLGRQISTTDPRTGTTGVTYNVAGQLESTNDGAGTTTYEYYTGGHLNAGRLKSQMNAISKKNSFNYNSRGDLIQTWGDTIYPLEYVYDGYGQRTELHTFRGGQNWEASIWPAPTTGIPDVTKWIYQESTGLVTEKLDAALKGTAYTYDELDRMKTRVWARGVTSTYGYDANTGELGTVTYSDSTPSVSFTYDRGGRPAVITDAAGTHTRTSNVAGDMETEHITGGILDGVGITIGYDNFLRRNSLQFAQGANTLSSQTYSYDASSQPQTVGSGGQSASYGYYPNSGLLNTTIFTGGTSITRSYDSIGHMATITTAPVSDVTHSYTYLYNNLNQSTRVTREDGGYWSYLYNDRGELESGRKYWYDNSIVWGAQTEYKFDNIGNRKLANNGGNQLGTLRQSSYTTNSLNQYSQRIVPGAVDMTGTANAVATVTINNQATIRKGEYFYKELAVNNTSGPAYSGVNVVGARNNFGAGGEDAITEKGGSVFVPAATETFLYDFDGNLTSDGRWMYTWDAENRLIGMQALAVVPENAKARLEFAYDCMGRRIRKQAYRWDVATSSYQLQTVTRFIYEKWNLGAELGPGNSLVRSYVWGSDQLLFINGGGNNYQVAYGSNENVDGLVTVGTGKLAATYEYDPYGQTIKLTGDYAAQNPFRFANQYTDSETDLVYYGFRYYNPNTGRWLSRDPIEERGGLNLYAMAANNPVNLIDVLGLQAKKGNRKSKSKAPEKCKCCCVEDLDVVTSGNFQGSLSLNNYFPFLSGQTEFLSSNPSVAGPFEDRGRSGTRIGAKVQIVSEIAKDNQGDYCNFSQHYWVGSEVVGGGFPRHKRGVTIDDIATSGQIQSQAPFRQDINGNPSIADPPSVESMAATNWQFWYTTCLSSGGNAIDKNCKKKQCCVKWVVMVRINGSAKKTQHTVYRESKWCW